MRPARSATWSKRNSSSRMLENGQGNWDDPLARATRGLRRMGRERPGALLARRTRTVKRIGRAPTLVLYSRNARPEKGLVRRPHVDQHACPFKREETNKFGRINYMDEGRSMCAVKGSLGHSLKARYRESDDRSWTRAVGGQSGHLSVRREQQARKEHLWQGPQGWPRRALPMGAFRHFAELTRTVSES